MNIKKIRSLFLLGILMPFLFNKAGACTRVVYTDNNGIVLTGRTMDWKTEMNSDIWAFPRGMQRSGEIEPNSLKWTSKYGSVITSVFGFASTDGINEKGLVANLLWFAEAQYPPRDKNKPGLSVAAWVQYILDNFETVDEAVIAMQSNTFQIVSDVMPNEDRMATLHLAVSDRTGDNAIFEYIEGKLNIYHNKEYKVLTNSPSYDQQLAIADYWKGVGGLDFLPGTNRATDRFARANFYTNALPKTGDVKVAIASLFSVIRNVSVPYGISTPNKPEISTTQWRTLSDSNNLIYFYEGTLTPNTFWIDLKKLNLSEDTPVMKLALADGQTYNGEASKDFKPAEAFTFMGVNE